jgi:hypothetical protein
MSACGRPKVDVSLTAKSGHFRNQSRSWNMIVHDENASDGNVCDQTKSPQAGTNFNPQPRSLAHSKPATIDR